MAVSTEENEQTYQAASDSTDGNSDAKHDEDGKDDQYRKEGMLMDMTEMRESLMDIREIKTTLKDMREMMESLNDKKETKEIAETMKSLVDLSQRGALDKDVVAPCVLKTSHSDGGAGTSPSGSGQQQLCSAPPQSQHASSKAQSGNIPEICVVKKSPNITAHQQVVYNSLAHIPHNLKEAVDWLMAVGGDDGMKNLKALGAALYDFYAHMSGRFTELSALDKVTRVSREFLEQEKLKSVDTLSVF